MFECQSAQLQAWLELVCKMIPGIRQAILLSDACEETAPNIQWPKAEKIHDDLLKTANLAASQKTTVTTTLSTAQGKDAAVDTIIAFTLSEQTHITATLAILVNIKPSQQAVVMQLLHWGDNWLQLLLQQEQKKPQAVEVSVEPVKSSNGFSFNKLSRVQLFFAGVFLLGVLMFTVTGMYHVTAPASLEGRIQRVIVAPFDSYISRAFSRAGETVTAGDVIAELDNRELLLQQQRYAAQKSEYTRQYRQALARRETAQSHIFKSQVNQAEAQLKLLQKKIQRSTLLAPLDGIIISGDLSRSLGAPVKAGDVLFEVAPLDEYRLVIFVDEKQVVDVQQNFRGVLNLKALPGTDINFTVDKVSPVFEENTDGIAYRVEATLNENHTILRPGMQGIAKIEIEQRSYAWIYLHKLYDAMRLWFWSWLP